MLTEDFDEVKGVEAQQQHQLVLTLSVITGSLWETVTMDELMSLINEHVYMLNNKTSDIP